MAKIEQQFEKIKGGETQSKSLKKYTNQAITEENYLEHFQNKNKQEYQYNICNLYTNFFLGFMIRTAINWEQISKHHAKCVCQTCTCHKHRCPHCQIHSPFLENTTYGDDYIKHPIDPWKKSPPQNAKPYEPYGDINSTYQTHYPGYKPQMRQKMMPRVKNEDRNIPFEGQSQYKQKYPGKSGIRDPIKNKDKIYTPIQQPFQGESTYTASYPKKCVNPHEKRKPQEYQFPPGYKFNGETTYGNSYTDKPLIPTKSCKPDEKIGTTGEHDLNTIYRKDYDEKKLAQPCPILKMPVRPSQVSQPNHHLVYNKYIHNWQQK